MKTFGLHEAEARDRAVALLVLEEQGDIVQPAAHRSAAYLLRGVLAIAVGLLFLSRSSSALLAEMLTFGAWVSSTGSSR